MTRDGEQSLAVKKWIECYGEAQTIRQRANSLKWLFVIFTATLFCTFGVFLLDGFGIYGFSLPEGVLDKLAWSTIGQIAGLMGISLRFLFR